MQLFGGMGHLFKQKKASTSVRFANRNNFLEIAVRALTCRHLPLQISSRFIFDQHMLCCPASCVQAREGLHSVLWGDLVAREEQGRS